MGAVWSPSSEIELMRSGARIFAWALPTLPKNHSSFNLPPPSLLPNSNSLQADTLEVQPKIEPLSIHKEAEFSLAPGYQENDL